MEVGGALPSSAKKALQMMPLLAVARTRAEPLEDPPPKELFTERPTAAPVPKRTVPPAATLSDAALGSLSAAPPAGPKTSIPTRMGAPVVFVQGKKVRDHRHGSPPAPTRGGMTVALGVSMGGSRSAPAPPGRRSRGRGTIV